MTDSNNIPDIGTPTRTEAILNRYDLSAKKGLGQNFLVDLNVLKKIVEVAEIGDTDGVIEIGPGIGALTEQLAKAAKKVVAFEIDANLIPVLDETLEQYRNIKVFNEDILQANLPEVIGAEFKTGAVKVVANLPYYITTPIVLDLIQNPAKFEAIVVMMQKEVAERLTAEPRTKAYGSLSVIIQQQNDVEVSFIVDRKSFVPSPNVDSAIIKITPKETITNSPFDQQKFYGFVRGCFMHRRKSLYNNLQGVFGKDKTVKETIRTVMTELELGDNSRPEELSVNQFVDLCNVCHSHSLLK
ncbi:16S rRNA (adenine(1518)-N(6)/adenine(1519)-N(6))-dimethyltransferase RsmA [Lentilactobacillus sp. Marseille-Q4993]|uniref:16S rRNA (adenine(1518)-N(6)/adenine(1519)-N(6))- dimethyltransferase RsmA n=1 Tax=Lentilactobacillus sp. Marseille-Q4993 TaxID=3039492 RepID=UPI0024BBED2A|nr:16S rRNA (adenine(1518)-N(6)/adenine(1519)-N(6))-dimethyltransferase RsmA [Lentilactobacillus sp. Marseille-Q4993]